jgi:hypothetical protein
MGCAKHRQKYVMKRVILVPNCPFYIGHTKNSFKKYLGHGDVHKTFFYIFLDIFNYAKNVFEMKVAYASGSKNAMS